ncbi:MAG TPA: HAMP domain-containing sensor histidine kinase [Steroidobacteraceae bacterium]|jgi:signal transduction histidine kinase|nr:HAMP domain-containing sensor histidine kinase [Steroidobacteraceae bacterium]
MKISPFRTSAARLALGYGAIFTLGVSALLGTVYFLTTTVIDNEVDAVISAELEGLTDEYRRDGLPGLAAELSFRGDSWNGTGAVYLLVDPNLGKEGGNLQKWPFDDIPAEQWTQFRIEAHANDSVVTHPVRASISLLPDGHRLLVGIDVTQQRRFANTFSYATLWGIGLTALAGAIAGYFLSRKLTRRVQSAADTCDAIVGGDLKRRLPVGGSQDEFDALALAVNNMVDRLAENAQLLRATFDSAAHDLRGPLYRLRGRLEDAGRMPTTDAPVRAGIDAALAELDRVQRTLATLLQIAQAESGMAAANRATVDVADLITDIGELYEPAAREKSMTLRVRAATNCQVNGNRQLLAQAVTNLVENSLKYIRAGGHIEIGTQRDAQTVWLWVSDDGPGIADEDRAAALKPFVRLPQAHSKDGSGLGLSLVAAIARLHHAQLLLEDNLPGLRVRLGLAAGA